MTVYTPMLPLSRGESFLENRVFSNPDEVAWSALDLQTRRDFVKHCDRGVFDPGTLASIAYDDVQLRHRSRGARRIARRARRGAGSQATARAGRRGVRRLRRGGGPHHRAPRLRDQLHRLRPAGAAARPLRRRAARGDRARGGPGLGPPPAAELALDRALALDGMEPRLHIPGLAALSQGPGFANLGSLGLLANRVLAPLVPACGSRASARRWWPRPRRVGI